MHAHTVLLVDDEQDILEALKTGIERGLPGLRVLAANDPQAALEALRCERVDIIISDQKMPGMEGVDLLAEARRRVPSADRVMMTGFATEALLQRTVNDAHIAHFFSKPYKLAEVLALLRKLVARREEANAGARELASTFAAALRPREQ